MTRWSHDTVLRALEEVPGPTGALVSAFPGRAASIEDTDWIRPWFQALVEQYAKGKPPKPLKLVVSQAEEGALSPLAKSPVDKAIRILSIQPNYFRGFRAVDEPVSVAADLILIEGRNSSGKTSLSEALEWLITGVLSRRSSGHYGSARELADCIANEFRPPKETTWVEAIFDVGGQRMRLKRVLIRDYSDAAQALPSSKLLKDGIELDETAQRRQYFERLLQIDELTALIEKAVIGDKKLEEFPPPSGTGALARLRQFVASLSNEAARQQLEHVEKVPSSEVPARLRSALAVTAQTSFGAPVDKDHPFEHCKTFLQNAQKAARDAEYPTLKILRGSAAAERPALSAVTANCKVFVQAAGDLGAAKLAAAAVTAADQAIALALEQLSASGVVNVDSEPNQLCPICADPRLTLTRNRIRLVGSWQPLTIAVQTAQTLFNRAVRALEEAVSASETALAGLVVVLPAVKQFEKEIKDASGVVRQHFLLAFDAAEQLNEHVSGIRANHAELKTAITSIDTGSQVKSLANASGQLIPLSTVLDQHIASQQQTVAHLDDAVGISARADDTYLRRDLWLEVAASAESIVTELIWDRALVSAQKLLGDIRKALIQTRTEIIEEARRTFSEQLTAIWQQLRSDIGAKFSRISIPTARGKGYKLELEVKAVLSDGKNEVEVDALRVFSESQINAIGIAAYITRGRLLGHSLLIFDDPVQSMDEEHFRSFSSGLLPALLQEGFQILILTHSDTFARVVANWHFDKDSFATLQTHYSKRRGCWVEEGNRRVAERLRNAERIAEDGQLELAWRFVRLALERLYTLIKKKADPEFDPESWSNASAEDMWKQGVSTFVMAVDPDAGKHLQEILRSTAYGAHDKTAPSQTDLLNSTAYVRTLLTKLRLGSG